MNRQVSPKQVALALGVSEASVKRWCDQGLMSPARTAGGHRRIAIHDVITFARSRGNPLVRPDVLGLPPVSGLGELAASRAVDEAFAILRDGSDERRLPQLLLNLYMGRWSMLDILERVLVEAFERIGTGWQHGQVGIYEERRAVELTLAAIRDISHVVPPAPLGAPLALGATLTGDPYLLPLAMGTLVLREVGLNSESWGTSLPAASLVEAIRKRRPDLVWIAMSAPSSEPARDLLALAEAASSVGAVLAVGGRGVPAKAIPAAATACQRFSDLAALARTLPSLAAGAPPESSPPSAAPPPPPRTVTPTASRPSIQRTPARGTSG